MTRLQKLYPVLGLWAGYLALLIGLEWALGFDRGFGVGNGQVVPLLSSPDRIIEFFGAADFASYIRAARLLPRIGFAAFHGGSFDMFPPGLPVIESGILALWPNGPIYAVLFGLSLSLWAEFFCCFGRFVQRVFQLEAQIAYLTPLALLAFPFFRNDCLWFDIGLTECIGTPVFAIAAIGMITIGLFPSVTTWKQAALYGLLFAIASYVRAQFDFIFMALACVSIASVAVMALRRVPVRNYILALVAVMGVYQGATIPYKIYKHAPTIVVIPYVWDIVWFKKEDAAKNGIMVEAGMQSVCQLDLVKCQEFTDRRGTPNTAKYPELKKAAMRTIERHPIGLLEIKLPIFWRYWFIDMFENPASPGSYRFFSEYLLFLGMPLACAYAFWRRWPLGLIYGLHAAAFLFADLIFSLIVHIEARYFLPIKLYSALSLIVMAVDLFRRKNRSKPD